MFQFPAFASRLARDIKTSSWWVYPFGNLRIKGRLHLPEAYRSLPRPSSPPRAKASTVRSFFLFLWCEIVINHKWSIPKFIHCELNCFARLIRNTIKVSQFFCFYIRQYVKDHFPQLKEESESAVPIKVLHLLLSTISEYRTGCVPYQYTHHHL